MLWSYGEKGESMPPITDLLILDSASSLATKIRTRKVSGLSYFNVLNQLFFLIR